MSKPVTDQTPDPIDVMTEWQHNVTNTCERLGDHIHDPKVPIPCDLCKSREQITRTIPWQEPYYFTMPPRSPVAAGLQVIPIPDADTRQEVDEDALNEDLDSLEDWESALRSTIRNQVTAGFNVTAQGDLADLLVRAHRWIAAAYLGRTD